jgi:hypothetical protein
MQNRKAYSWTPGERKVIEDLYSSGVKPRIIAHELGDHVSRHAIESVLWRAKNNKGKTFNRRFWVLEPEVEDDIIARWNRGESRPSIARIYKTNKHCIHGVLRRRADRVTRKDEKPDFTRRNGLTTEQETTIIFLWNTTKLSAREIIEAVDFPVKNIHVLYNLVRHHPDAVGRGKKPTPENGPILFIEARFGQCRMPLWPDNQKTGFVCGKPVVMKEKKVLSWCQECLTVVSDPERMSKPRSGRKFSNLGFNNRMRA